MTMSKGWVCLHRSIQYHWIWEDSKYLKWWITILMCVNHEEKKYPVGADIHVCQPGQSFRSIEKWTELFSCSKKTTIKFFEMLKNDGMISTKIVGSGNRRKHLLTVCNWGKYQTKETENSTERVPECSANGNPNIPPNNNDKQLNNENNISTNVDCPNIGDSDSQKARKINYKELLDLYHSICVSLPKVQKLTDSRKNKIRIRIREIEKQFKDTRYTIVLNDLFSKMESSDFMKGSNTRNWRASLDWLFENSENWVKVLEGKYDNRSDNLRDQEFVNNLLGKGGCQTYIIPDDGPKSEYKYINGKLTLVVD